MFTVDYQIKKIDKDNEVWSVGPKLKSPEPHLEWLKKQGFAQMNYENRNNLYYDKESNSIYFIHKIEDWIDD